MRVLLLNYEYPPLGGGAGVATHALAHELAGMGVHVDIVTATNESSKGSALTVERRDRSSGGRLFVRRVRSWRKARHQAGMGGAIAYVGLALPAVRRLLRSHEYDVVHCFFSLPTGALLPLLPERDVATVVSLRGSDVPGYDPTNRVLQLAHRVAVPLNRWVWRRADRVVALSENLGQLARMTDPALDYTVIRNGVNVERFRPGTRADDAAGGPVRCLAVARLVERKGLTDLIRAFALLDRSRYRLEIVGSGQQGGELRALTESLRLQDVVRFAGAMDHDEVAQRYQEAELFTLASRQESFGNVFAEALASGLPIVGTTAGGVPEFVEHGRNGLLVPPGEPARLAEAIDALGSDPDRRRQIARTNRQTAENTLSWRTVALQYMDVYASARQQRAPTSRTKGSPVGRVASW